MTKDYYRILGVLDDAEDIVIRAAYKALAQRYHPDKWTGSPEEATRRMQEINEAYAVLSDPNKRKQYDSSRGAAEFEEQGAEYEDDLVDSLESDWKEVLVYFPDLKIIAERLSKTSKSLEYTYKVIVLEHKKFNDRHKLADNLEQHFLETYFGKNQKIINFAKQLIAIGDKKSAKELNRAVNLLGSEVDPHLIINKIVEKNKRPAKPNPTYSSSQDSDIQIKKDALSLIRQPCLPYAKIFFEGIGGQVHRMDENWNYYLVTYQNEQKKIPADRVIDWALSIARTVI